MVPPKVTACPGAAASVAKSKLIATLAARADPPGRIASAPAARSRVRRLVILVQSWCLGQSDARTAAEGASRVTSRKRKRAAGARGPNRAGEGNGGLHGAPRGN